MREHKRDATSRNDVVRWLRHVGRIQGPRDQEARQDEIGMHGRWRDIVGPRRWQRLGLGTQRHGRRRGLDHGARPLGRQVQRDADRSVARYHGAFEVVRDGSHRCTGSKTRRSRLAIATATILDRRGGSGSGSGSGSDDGATEAMHHYERSVAHVWSLSLSFSRTRERQDDGESYTTTRACCYLLSRGLPRGERERERERDA